MNANAKGSASQRSSNAGLTRVSMRPAALQDARIKSAHDGAPDNAAGSKRLVPSTRSSRLLIFLAGRVSRRFWN
ncbi:MAG: hypothetical protein L0Y57_08675 [Beijerinckiaceae bacterium]|nr:hypothetical protein [Beijerinckiaceae bacterium]